MKYITFDNLTKIVTYIGDVKPTTFGDNQTLGGANEISDEYDYLTVGNSTNYGEIKIYELIPHKFEIPQSVINDRLNNKYIPSINEAYKILLNKYLSEISLEDNEKLEVSGLYEKWQLGNYKVGDIRNYAGQTWECHQAHDNAVYPDINPNNLSTWATFWRPLHGKSVETARPWVKPVAGTTDMYHVGEYMIYTDNKIYKCLRDSVYSPEEYASDWEII